MRCLECNAPTTEFCHEGVPVHVCPAGHGSWMQPEDLLIAVRTDPAAGGRTNTVDEVEAILEAQVGDVESSDDTRVCPMCARPMGSVRYAYITSVVVDACPEHGIWLDVGELDELEQWAAARFASEPRPMNPTAELPSRAERLAAKGRPAPVIADGSPPSGFVGWLRCRLGRSG